MGETAKAYLQSIAHVPDGEIDLAQATLALAALHNPTKSLHAAESFFEKLSADMHALSSLNTAADQVASLQQILYTQYGFKGDDKTYDDLQNTDIASVIHRRQGIPITLAILVLQAAHYAGWDVQGVNFPGHFLLRFNAGGAQILCDPFEGLKQVAAPQLRSILKRVHGERAELSATYLEPTTKRETLLRLENNIKFRQIEAEDFEQALETVHIMQLISPLDSRLWFDEGLLLARLERPADAVQALEMYRKTSQNLADKEQAAQLIQALSQFIN